MSQHLSLSIFTIEVDRVPIAAMRGRKQAEAELTLTDEFLKEQLRRLRSGGKPLCDDFSIFRMRIARPGERAQYFENVTSLLTSDSQLVVLLIKLDDPC